MIGSKRQQIEAIWNGDKPDYFPHEPCGFWKETIDRWHNEGLPLNVDPNTEAGLGDSWFAVLPLNSGMCPEFDVKIISEDENYVILVDELGVRKKMMKSDFQSSQGKLKFAGETSSMSEWLEFPVKTLSDWEKLFAERFKPNLAGRLPDNWDVYKKELKKQSEEKIIMYYNFPGFGSFGAIRQLMGYENMVMACADTPELVHKMVKDLTDHFIVLFKQVFFDVKIDMAMLFEDMCYKQSSLISPHMFMEFFGDMYSSLSKLFKEHGISQLHIDTDGNAMKMIPSFLSVGVTGLFPLEVQSGMDPAEIRDLYPTLFLKGGIDKRALIHGKEAIEKEIKDKFDIAWSKGMYLPWVDHGIPPDVSWDNFRYFVEIYKKYANQK